LSAGLRNATRFTQTKGEYGKAKHSFDILAGVDPEKVKAASPHAERLIATLLAQSETGELTESVPDRALGRGAHPMVPPAPRLSPSPEKLPEQTPGRATGRLLLQVAGCRPVLIEEGVGFLEGKVAFAVGVVAGD
jgi:hypothetical protein